MRPHVDRPGRRPSARHRLLVLCAVGVAVGAAACGNSGGGSAGGAVPGDIVKGPGAHAVTVGDPPLTGTLTIPRGRGPFPAVVMLSGSGPEDQDETVADDKPFLDIARGLAAQGVATLRYDKRAYEYPGSIDLATITPTQEYVPDALAAIRLLAQEPEIDHTRIFVLGHSEGGTVAPKVVQRAPRVAGLILLAASTEDFGETLLRQIAYVSTLPGTIGQEARQELPEAEQAQRQIDNPKLSVANRATWPTSPLAGGLGAAYWLGYRELDPVGTARALPQPILILQGGRDYQVTVADDLAAWERGLAGRPGVTVHVYPDADHLFIDGTGAPTPADYDRPAHVDPQVIGDIAAWVHSH